MLHRPPVLMRQLNVSKLQAYNNILDSIKNLPENCNVLLEWNLNTYLHHFQEMLSYETKPLSSLNFYNLVYIEIKDGLREQKHKMMYGDINEIKENEFYISLV